MIYRRSAKAYENDHIGFKLSKQLIESGEWENYKFMDQKFILLPFEHQEWPKIVQEGLGKFYNFTFIIYYLEWGLQYQERFKGRWSLTDENTAYFYKMASLHLDLLNRFGRYPHRNHVFGRESTLEEIEYMENGETFNQK